MLLRQEEVRYSSSWAEAPFTIEAVPRCRCSRFDVLCGFGFSLQGRGYFWCASFSRRPDPPLTPPMLVANGYVETGRRIADVCSQNVVSPREEWRRCWCVDLATVCACTKTLYLAASAAYSCAVGLPKYGVGDFGTTGFNRISPMPVWFGNVSAYFVGVVCKKHGVL